MKSLKTWAIAPALVASSLMTATPAQAGSDPYIGDIVAMPYNFCPRGWVEASGQLLSIASNTALFSLLGTTYGGNGTVNFALPDLRGRVAIGDGQGPGLTSRVLGEQSGQENVTILSNQLPSHTHSGALRANAAAGNTNVAVGNRPAQTPGNSYSSLPNPANFMNADTITSAATGGGQPVPIIKPYLAIRHCLALQGVFPPRP